MWRQDSYLWKRLESFLLTGSMSVVKALLGSLYCPNILGVPSTYFISKFWTLSALAGLSSLPQGSCMKWNLYSLWVNRSYLCSCPGHAWKDLEAFGQLNNVNLKPINILLWFRLGKTFSTLNKYWRAAFVSCCLTFSAVKSQSPCGAWPHGLHVETEDEKQCLN